MAVKKTFLIKTDTSTKAISATPHQAAREAARFTARGTFIRSKSMWEQPEGAHGGVPVKLVDQHGDVVMSCRPTLRSRSGRSRQMFAQCDIKPAFKRLLKRHRR